jgi:hypothetical protein
MGHILLADTGTMTQSQPVSPFGIQGVKAILFGLPFTGFGGFLVLAATGVVSVPSTSVSVPMWIIGVLGGVFAAPGLMLVAHGAACIARRQRAKSRTLLHPAEPWLADHAWNPSGTLDRATPVVFHALGLTIVLGLMTAANWFAVTMGGLPGVFVKVVVGLGDLLVLAILWSLAKRAMNRMRYGRSRLAFNTFPFFCGREVDATLTIARGVGAVEQLSATLRCLQEAYVNVGSGDDQRTEVCCRELHAETMEMDPRGSLSLRIPLPEDAPGSDLVSRPARFWELHVTAATGDRAYETRFILPIYAPAA